MAKVQAQAPSALHSRATELADSVGAFIEYWGFKAAWGRVWTVLAISSEPLSQVDIAERLAVSRALVSGTISDLTRLGLVRPTSEHRNAPYEAVLDVWSPISSILRDREWMLIESARLSLEGVIEELDLAPHGERALYDRERLQFLLRMTEIAQAFLKLLIGIRVPTKLRGIGSWLKTSSKFLSSLRSIK